MRTTSLFNDRPGHSPALTILGLAWVYSGALWLLMLPAAAWPLGTMSMVLRLAATLAVGVGLCAMERWAWAWATSLATVYAGLGLGLGAGISWALAVDASRALSWEPVFFTMNTAACARLAPFCWAGAVAGAANLWLLWRNQAQFEIPHRRPFSCLVRFGLGPSMLVLAVDASLALGWLGR